MEKYESKVLSQSLVGKALTYARNQWSELEKFVDAGHIEIDNNFVESAIRPTAVGKKNWLFIGSAEAGERNALVCTPVANCRRHGVELNTNLKDFLTRLPRMSNQEVEQMTPLNWQKNRQATLQTAA